MKHFLRRKRLQRLRKSLVGKTFVEIKNGRGITHRILWVSQSLFGDKPVRVGIKSSNRTAVRWVPHHTFAAASQRAAYGFECRRRVVLQNASEIPANLILDLSNHPDFDAEPCKPRDEPPPAPAKKGWSFWGAEPEPEEAEQPPPLSPFSALRAERERELKTLASP